MTELDRLLDCCSKTFANRCFVLADLAKKHVFRSPLLSSYVAPTIEGSVPCEEFSFLVADGRPMSVEGIWTHSPVNIVRVQIKVNDNLLLELDEPFATGKNLQWRLSGLLQTVREDPNILVKQGDFFYRLNITRQKGQSWFFPPVFGGYTIRVTFDKKIYPPSALEYVASSDWSREPEKEVHHLFCWPRLIPKGKFLLCDNPGTAFLIHFQQPPSWKKVQFMYLTVPVVEMNLQQAQEEARKGGLDPQRWAVLPVCKQSIKWWNVETERTEKMNTQMLNASHSEYWQLEFEGGSDETQTIYWLSFNWIRFCAGMVVRISS